MRLSGLIMLAFILLSNNFAAGIGDTPDNQLLIIAKNYINENEPQDAIPILDKVIQEDSTNKDALYLRGYSSSALGQYSDAIVYYNRALCIEEGNVSAWYGKCQALIDLERCEESERCIRELSQRYPESENIQELSGIALTQTQCVSNYAGNEIRNSEQYDQALQYYDIAIALDPNSTSAWNNKGVALGEVGRLNESIECFTKALNKNPSFIEAWNNMGVSFDLLEMNQKSIECYDQAITIDPLFAEAWYNKGQTLALNSSTYNVAKECYGKAIKLNPMLKGGITWIYKNTFPLLI